MPIGAWSAGITAKGAKAAVLNAVVGEVEIPVHHVGDRLSNQLLPQGIGLLLKADGVATAQ